MSDKEKAFLFSLQERIGHIYVGGGGGGRSFVWFNSYLTQTSCQREWVTFPLSSGPQAKPGRAVPLAPELCRCSYVLPSQFPLTPMLPPNACRRSRAESRAPRGQNKEGEVKKRQPCS